MDKATISAYASVGCFVAAVVFGSIGAIYGYHPWREAVERRKAQRNAAVPVRTRRSAFVWWSTATVFLLIASSVFAEAWLYFGIMTYHPRLYLVYAATIILAVIGFGAFVGNTVDRVLQDNESARADLKLSLDEVIALNGQLSNKDAECTEKLRAVIRSGGPNEPLAVELEPTRGKNDKQFLVVTNKGQKQDFHAQCQLLEDFNGRRILRSYQLSWENGAIRGPLSRDESGNLVIAIAGQDRQNELNYIALQTMSGGRWERLEFERWNFGEKPTDIKFRLNITVIGEETQTSKSQDFIVRPGTSCALEMFPPESEPSPTSDLFSPLQLEAFQLARDLRAFLDGLGPRPTVDKATFPETPDGVYGFVRATMAVERPWLNRLHHEYVVQFDSRVDNILHRLAAESLRDFALEAAAKAVGDENGILEIAERLPLLAIRLSFPPRREVVKP